MTADVLTWLTGTLADVEREAWDGVSGNDQHRVWCDWVDVAVQCCHCGVPAAVLASVEVDRAILADHSVEAWPDGLTSCSRCGGPGDCPWPCTTVYLVASRYRHRPKYQAEWEVTS